MVAKVISGKNLQGALNYNEQKVRQGKAQCIQANLFKADVDALSFHDKLSRFASLNERNRRAKTNTLHISLNFDISEKLSVDELNKIASTYMQKIGFGDQPYLVYEHLDAAHPHLHVVTTIIRENGKRIPIHNLGKNQSEKARCEIELEFRLVQAQSKRKSLNEHIPVVELRKATYGRSETKRSIVNIVRAVTQSYKYTSLPELNAVLRQFNVVADRGNERSQMFQKNGLQYCIIDENGKRVGAPIKASAIYGKPTLAFLEKQFKLNEVLRQPHKRELVHSIEQVFNTTAIASKELFKNALDKRGIVVSYRTNTAGRTYGITFIDNRTRVVFNGSDLGKNYSANVILERLEANNDTTKSLCPGYTILTDHSKRETKDDCSTSNALALVLEDLVTTSDTMPSSPEAALKLQRKRKRRRGHKL